MDSPTTKPHMKLRSQSSMKCPIDILNKHVVSLFCAKRLAETKLRIRTSSRDSNNVQCTNMYAEQCPTMTNLKQQKSQSKAVTNSKNKINSHLLPTWVRATQLKTSLFKERAGYGPLLQRRPNVSSMPYQRRRS